jgi:hypothetical protein
MCPRLISSFVKPVDRMKSSQILVANSSKFSFGRNITTSCCPRWWNHFQTFSPKYFLYLPPYITYPQSHVPSFCYPKNICQIIQITYFLRQPFSPASSCLLYFYVLTYFYKQTQTHTHAHTHTQTLGRTPMDEGSARRRDLDLTTHNIHKSQKFIYQAGFELATPASEWPPESASLTAFQ